MGLRRIQPIEVFASNEISVTGTVYGGRFYSKECTSVYIVSKFVIQVPAHKVFY
jgi:hypothetical protein